MRARAGGICAASIAGVLLLFVAGCETSPASLPTPRQEAREMQNLVEAPGVDGGRDALLRYDIDGNGEITSEEMKSTIAADFISADANGDKKLDIEETRAANERRWAIDASRSTPLIDWNQDSYVTMAEFSNSVHALFERFDLNGDGIVNEDELNARASHLQREDWKGWRYGRN